MLNLSKFSSRNAAHMSLLFGKICNKKIKLWQQLSPFNLKSVALQ